MMNKLLSIATTRKKSPFVQKSKQTRNVLSKNKKLRDEEFAFVHLEEGITDKIEKRADHHQDDSIQVSQSNCTSNQNETSQQHPHHSDDDFDFVQLEDHNHKQVGHVERNISGEARKEGRINSAKSTLQHEEINFTSTKNLEQSHDLRYRTEEGFAILQIMGFVCGIFLTFSSMLSLQEEGRNGLAFDVVFISFYSWIFGIFITALEGRIFMFNILSLHRLISNYVKILRFLWGRGLFYMFVGSFHLCLMTFYSKICGFSLILLGTISFIVGLITYKQLSQQQKFSREKSLTQQLFNFYDSDSDGYIDIETFRDLIIGTGVMVNDIDNEFYLIDLDNDGLINFPDVKVWFDSLHSNSPLHIDSIWLY